MGCGFENTLGVEVVTKFTAEFDEIEKVAVNDRILQKYIHVDILLLLDMDNDA